MTPRHLEVWFGLNTGQYPRHSNYRARIRWGERGELWEARFMFEGGVARPGAMVHALVWFRSPAEALADVRPTDRFDVLELQRVVATGEVLTK